ncbi:MAG: FAD-dependent oxidoreductase [Pseudomonadota bacterium]
MKIAVIGSGVSGLGAALALSERHEVLLFEKDQRFGGHANTVEIDYDGVATPVDTGFIVFNTHNYPNLSAMFEALGVATEDSDMTFAVSADGGRLEYACDGLDKVFAQRWRALDPKFLRTFLEILRFHRQARGALAAGEMDGLSLGEWLDRSGYGRHFREKFLLPMGGAIWSTSVRDMLDFPAQGLVQFFANHHLLEGFERKVTWRTVSGGSREYVSRALKKLGPRAQAGVGAVEVRRIATGQVRVRFDDGSDDVFDQVVLACHSDQALRLLADPDPMERSLLASVRYSDNVAVLHRDRALMPRREKVWSSWCFMSEQGADARPPAVSYWMNKLQNIDRSRPLFVTLNPHKEIDPALEFGRWSYAHPLFDQAAFDAQGRFDLAQGRRGVWFAGAWLGWGFHEDGLRSGLRVADALGARPDWAVDLGAPLRPSIAIAAE